MIDFARIRRRRSQYSLLIELLLNAPQFFLIVYGLISIATGHSFALWHKAGTPGRSLHLVPVTGHLATLFGLQYLGFGLFFYFSGGEPPDESRSTLWRVGRFFARWAPPAVAIVCFINAFAVLAGISSAGIPPYLFAKAFLFIAGPIAAIQFLLAMFSREQIKVELDADASRPLRIRWVPAAYWAFSFPWSGARGFRVIYVDWTGLIHRRHCIVYRSFVQDWRWGNRRVVWLTDAVSRD